MKIKTKEYLIQVKQKKLLLEEILNVHLHFQRINHLVDVRLLLYLKNRKIHGELLMGQRRKVQRMEHGHLELIHLR